MLFVYSKISHLAMLPQGKVEAKERAAKMMAKMDEEGFGACTNTQACSVECPKEIPQSVIARVNREFLTAKFVNEDS
jgi:succinate dehydrogenase / fumarate reductase iron-sulfur subunit